MEYLLNLPPLINIPRPNLYANDWDKYEKIHQIKYFSFCKKILLQTINALEFEIGDLELYIRQNENCDYTFHCEHSVIENNKNQISVYYDAFSALTRTIDYLWWQIRNVPPC